MQANFGHVESMTKVTKPLSKEGLLALVFLTTVGYFQTRPSDNEWAHWAPALSYLERGDWTILPSQTHDWSMHEGRCYSNKAPGLSMLAIPLLAVLPKSPERLPGSFAVANLLLNGVPAVLAVIAFFRVARTLVADERTAAVAAGTFALGTMTLPFATAFFAHQVVASLLFLSFALLWFGKLPLLAGFLAGVATLCDYPAAIGVVALTVFAFTRSPRAAVLFVLGGIPLVAPMLIYHDACFGSPWTLPHAKLNPIMSEKNLVLGMFGRPQPAALPGLTVSPYRGLFFSSPHLLAALGGLVMLAKTKHRSIAILGGTLFAAFLAMNLTFTLWHAGGTYGPRYLIPCLPFLALGLAPAYEKYPQVRWLALPALLVTLATVATGLIIPPEFRFPLFQWTAPRLLHPDEAVRTVLGLRAPWSLLPVAGLWTWAGWKLCR